MDDEGPLKWDDESSEECRIEVIDKTHGVIKSEPVSTLHSKRTVFSFKFLTFNFLFFQNSFGFLGNVSRTKR